MNGEETLGRNLKVESSLERSWTKSSGYMNEKYRNVTNITMGVNELRTKGVLECFGYFSPESRQRRVVT